MPLKLYPIEIECVDAMDDLVFKLRTFDEYSANLEFKGMISPGNVDELCTALKQAVAGLELKHETTESAP